jgi:hypothetical protein
VSWTPRAQWVRRVGPADEGSSNDVVLGVVMGWERAPRTGPEPSQPSALLSTTDR